MSKVNPSSRSSLSSQITRRDFIGTTLVGAGAALLSRACPANQRFGLGQDWTGYGGVGDYRFSNGNTAEVVQSSHRIRDRAFSGERSDVIETGEQYDAVIVGGGFAGMTALYEFRKRNPQGTYLLIDNHPIFGGFAKSNEFDVDGYRLVGAQASVDCLPPAPPVEGRRMSDGDELWRELGIPDQFTFAKQEGGNPSIKFPRASSSAMYWAEPSATIGYFFRNSLTNDNGVWVKDIWSDELKRAPWPEHFKQELLTLRGQKIRCGRDDQAAWLDSFAYADFVTQVMRLSPQVLSYFSPIMNSLGSPQVSAYAARRVLMPGVSDYPGQSPLGDLGDRFMSFPGGNATLLRHIVKAIFPDAIRGPRTFAAIANNSINLAALDRPGANHRMRLGATTMKVQHEANSTSSERVAIFYEKDGRLYRVAARGVVVSAGSWVARHIVDGLPDDFQSAFGQFLYAPVLIVNVALRNWRFLDKLGFSAARWFDGFGFYSTVIQPMIIGNRSAPFHPDKPIVMTFYVQIPTGDLPLAAQGPASRSQLYSTSYRDYERQIVSQMQSMFAVGGFEARRDIAGIVLNRWGHARMSPPPGFFFGKSGASPPTNILRRPFGRISFGNSELSGFQSWASAVTEGKRAAMQILDLL